MSKTVDGLSKYLRLVRQIKVSAPIHLIQIAGSLLTPLLKSRFSGKTRDPSIIFEEFNETVATRLDVHER